MINFESNSTFASGVWGLTLHVDVAFKISGILNTECAVLPPGNRVAAIPVDATGIA